MGSVGSVQANNNVPATSDPDQGVRDFQKALTDAGASGKAQYAAAQSEAAHIRAAYEQAHGSSYLSRMWYDDRAYLSPQQKQLFDQAQNANDVERKGDVTAAEVAGRSFLGTGTAGVSEVALAGAGYMASNDKNETWQRNFNEMKEDREAGERLHPWASRFGTVAGVGAFVFAGWEGLLGRAAIEGGTALAGRAAIGGAVTGGIAGASYNADTLGHAAVGGGMGATLGAGLGAGSAKTIEVASPYVARALSSLKAPETLPRLEGATMWEVYGGTAAHGPEATHAVEGSTALEAARSRITGAISQRSRQLELGFDPKRRLIEAEGIGGARLERALGRKITRSSDADFDFIDGRLGKIQLKGPIPASGNVEGLAHSVVRDVTKNTASDVVVVDTLGLSSEQLNILKSIIRQGTGSSTKPILYLG